MEICLQQHPCTIGRTSASVVNQSINQSSDQSSDRSTNQPSNQSVNQSINHQHHCYRQVVTVKRFNLAALKVGDLACEIILAPSILAN